MLWGVLIVFSLLAISRAGATPFSLAFFIFFILNLIVWRFSRVCIAGFDLWSPQIGMRYTILFAFLISNYYYYFFFVYYCVVIVTWSDELAYMYCFVCFSLSFFFWVYGLLRKKLVYLWLLFVGLWATYGYFSGSGYINEFSLQNAVILSVNVLGG